MQSRRGHSRERMRRIKQKLPRRSVLKENVRKKRGKRRLRKLIKRQETSESKM